MAARKIAVIGGGPIGLSTALHVAQQAGAGANVVVIERDTSYRKCSALLSAGGIRQQFSLPENVLMSKYSFDYLADLEERSREKGYEIAFKRNGYLFLGTSEKDKLVLEANNQTQRDCGVDWIHLANKLEVDDEELLSRPVEQPVVCDPPSPTHLTLPNAREGNVPSVSLCNQTLPKSRQK